MGYDTLWLTVLVCSIAAPAAAYRTAADLADIDAEHVAWEPAEVRIGFAEGAFSDDAFRNAVSEEAAAQVLAAAANTWNEVSCSTFEFVTGGRPDVVIRVETNWAARGFDEDAAATTDVSYRVGSGEASIGGAQLTLNAAAFTGESPPDLQAVLTHELGHVLGLLHPCEGAACTRADEASALHPEYRASQLMLGSDDIAGVCFLYPSECDDPGCEVACRDAVVSEECPWLGDPCLGETGSSCAYGRCASDGYCSLSCNTDRDCSARDHCAEGLCVPERVARYGEACERGNDCQSLLCVSVPDGDGGGDSMCTRGCDGIDCPGDDICSLVDDQAVCTPPLSSGGCAAIGTSSTSNPIAFAMILGALLWRRRPQHRSSSQTRR